MAKKRIPQGIIGYGSSFDQFSPERLASFPSTDNFAGRFIQLTTDGLYYKRNEANNGWDTVGNTGNVIQSSNSGFAGRVKVSGGADKSITDYVGTSGIMKIAGGVLGSATAESDYTSPSGLATELLNYASKGLLASSAILEIHLVDTTVGRTPAQLISGFSCDGTSCVPGIKVLITDVTNKGVYIIQPSGAAILYATPMVTHVDATMVSSLSKFKYHGLTDNGYVEIAVPYVSQIAKTTPVDADNIPIYDSANQNIIKKLSFANLKTLLGAIYQSLANKDASNGYAGLTLFKLNLKNVAGTFTNFFTNTTTAARTWTMQDRDGTIADDTDITNAKNRANHTGTQLASTISDFNAAADARIAIGTAGLYDDRGNYNASVGTFPTTGGSGSAGAINKGDVFLVSVAGTLGGVAYSIGDSFRALVDTPGQTAGNWASMKQGSTLSNVVIKNTPTLIGNASLTVIPVTHNLNTYNVKAIVRKVSDNTIWDVDPTGTSVNVANLDFGAYVPATNEFEVVMFA